MQQADVLVRARNLVKHYPAKGHFGPSRLRVHAVEDLSLEIRRGEVVALVGESGSGKSTVGKLLLRLIEPTSGEIRFDGTDLRTLSRTGLRQARRRMQMIFQDPYASLNPHRRIGAMLEEPLKIHGLGGSACDRRDRVESLLRKVGLPENAVTRYPHEFSGGQRQRLCIARALAVEPELIVADEAISALDVSNQAQIINVLMQLRDSRALALLFISHNLAVVRNIADTVAVMYLGRMMEVAPVDSLFEAPLHPYTAALLGAVPVPEPGARRDRIVLKGDIPSPLAPPSGCVFRTRCPRAIAACAETVPALREIAPRRWTACIRVESSCKDTHAA